MEEQGTGIEKREKGEHRQKEGASHLLAISKITINNSFSRSPKPFEYINLVGN